MYRKNFFGDVTAIYNGTTKVAEYVYDAWGNCTVTTNINGYGTRNPFRYRGYYFDTDLNMYYLLTRYYDPQIGRFINADTPEYLKPSKINGLNLYAYCGNNPVMYVDPSGHEPMSATAAILWLTGIYAVLLGGPLLYYFTTDYEERNKGYTLERIWSDLSDLGNSISEAIDQAIWWPIETLIVNPIAYLISALHQGIYVTREHISDIVDGFKEMVRNTKYSMGGGVSNPQTAINPSDPISGSMPNQYWGGSSGGGTLPDHSGYDIWDENGWLIE